MGQKFLLSQNNQCQITEGTLTITSARPRPFFIHNQTPHETGVGPFMPAVQHQYQTVTTTTTTATQQQLV